MVAFNDRISKDIIERQQMGVIHIESVLGIKPHSDQLFSVVGQACR